MVVHGASKLEDLIRAPAAFAFAIAAARGCASTLYPQSQGVPKACSKGSCTSLCPSYPALTFALCREERRLLLQYYYFHWTVWLNETA